MRAGRPVIALIDDDPLFRGPIALGLDAAGYTVIGAASGLEAIGLLADRDIDVALVDVNMPGPLDGIAAVREVKRTNPGLKVIFISGRRPAEDLSDLGPFLAKPFRLDDLLAAIGTLTGPIPPSSGATRPLTKPRRTDRE